MWFDPPCASSIFPFYFRFPAPVVFESEAVLVVRVLMQCWILGFFKILTQLKHRVQHIYISTLGPKGNLKGWCTRALSALGLQSCRCWGLPNIKEALDSCSCSFWRWCLLITMHGWWENNYPGWWKRYQSNWLFWPWLYQVFQECGKYFIALLTFSSVLHSEQGIMCLFHLSFCHPLRWWPTKILKGKFGNVNHDPWKEEVLTLSLAQWLPLATYYPFQDIIQTLLHGGMNSLSLTERQIQHVVRIV